MLPIDLKSRTGNKGAHFAVPAQLDSIEQGT